jgi:hypothetical protein
MKTKLSTQRKYLAIVSAFAVVFVAGACLVAAQNIDVPSEHISQNIEVTLDK